MANPLIKAVTNEIFFLMLYNLITLIIFIKYKQNIILIEILIYDHDNILHDSIIRQIPEENLTVLDILNYLQSILNGKM